MDRLTEYQSDMRRAYLWGATGIITSGIVWLIAAAVAFNYPPHYAVWTLFIGASFIVPVANLVDRLLGAAGKHSVGNKLAALALESTVFMLMCLPLAYGLSLYKMEWFFPAVLMIIAGRYLTFASIYGTRLYWLLGVLLGAVALAAFKFEFSPALAALGGALTELIFGAVLLWVKRRQQ